DVPLENADADGVAAQVLPPGRGAGVVVGGGVLFEHERGGADGLVEGAGVGDPQADGAWGGRDGDEDFVFVSVEVLGELAPLVLDLLGGHAGRQVHVDFYAASGDADRPEERGADVAHGVDGLTQRGDSQVAEGDDDNGRGDGGAQVAGLGWQRPLRGGVPLLADDPDGGEADPGGGEQERAPDDARNERGPTDQLDEGFDGGEDVPDVPGAPGEHAAGQQQDAGAADGPVGDGLGGVDHGLQQFQAPLVAGGPGRPV